ncbi:hypothetical protein PENTCL1PPCAC_27709 [Pristionchus entomophagus]|uniref:RING-type domain-containing protein n=1 Tax=Pristionchus entomophagus TaxID=358040 RepID=A0AAV5UI07_9BILA|nr:hypothetical protein PENTCL1PPCAC_27709 [Pristionchus entomophagus]
MSSLRQSPEGVPMNLIRNRINIPAHRAPREAELQERKERYRRERVEEEYEMDRARTRMDYFPEGTFGHRYHGGQLARHTQQLKEILDRQLRDDMAGFEPIPPPQTRQVDASAAAREERDRYILELELEDYQSPAQEFKRECSVCANENPNRRVVLTACGHAVCRVRGKTHASRIRSAKSVVLSVLQD